MRDAHPARLSRHAPGQFSGLPQPIGAPRLTYIKGLSSVQRFRRYLLGLIASSRTTHSTIAHGLAAAERAIERGRGCEVAGRRDTAGGRSVATPFRPGGHRGPTRVRPPKTILTPADGSASGPKSRPSRRGPRRFVTPAPDLSVA